MVNRYCKFCGKSTSKNYPMIFIANIGTQPLLQCQVCKAVQTWDYRDSVEPQKKTLSDYQVEGCVTDKPYLPYDKVKQAIKEFLCSGFDWNNENDVRNKAKQIFGERLL